MPESDACRVCSWRCAGLHDRRVRMLTPKGMVYLKAETPSQVQPDRPAEMLRTYKGKASQKGPWPLVAWLECCCTRGWSIGTDGAGTPGKA